MISVFIFTSNDFRPWKIEERERERKSKKIALSEQEYNQIASKQDNHTASIVQTHPRRTQSPIIKIISPFLDHAQRERQREKEERVERSSHHRQDRLAIVLKPTCTKSPMNPLTPRQSHQIAPRQRTHHSDEPIHQTHHSDEWVFFHSDRAIDEFFLVGFCLEAKKM